MLLRQIEYLQAVIENGNFYLALQKPLQNVLYPSLLFPSRSRN